LEKEKEEITTEKRPILKKLVVLGKAMEDAKRVLSASSQKDEKSEDLIEIESKIKEERETKDSLYRKAGKIEGELNANQRNIEKIKLEESREETKTIPLKEVEDLEKEISTFSEVIKVVEKIRSFIAKHKANSNPSTSSEQVMNLNELIEINKGLENNKKEVEEKIGKIDIDLKELESKYNEIKKSIEKEKDSSREAEKNIFKISAEQSEFRSKMELLKEREYRLTTEENDWKREIEEGGVLLGTVIVGFENEELEEDLQESSQEKVWSNEERRPEDFSERTFLTNLEPHENSHFTKASHFVKTTRDESRDKQKERRKELEKMKIRLEEFGGGGGVEAMKEYKETVERDDFLTKELEDLKKSAKSLEMLIKELLEKLDLEFKEGIEKINKSFHEFFTLMFGGGEAKLEVTKSYKLKAKSLELGKSGYELEDEESKKENGETGIEISVSLPRKRIKGLEMLSGGERALTSIALLFAISQVNPPPFIILDETDAALDEANSKKYGEMIESLSKVSQLILITHNRETMSRAGVIYGVTMGGDSVSKLLSIEFDEAVAVAK